MTSRFAALAVDAVEPTVVAAFWCAALGWQVVEEDPEGVTLAPHDGSWPVMAVLRVPEGKTVKNRLHLDLRADGTSVLANPGGKEFRLLSTAVQDL